MTSVESGCGLICYASVRPYAMYVLKSNKSKFFRLMTGTIGQSSRCVIFKDADELSSTYLAWRRLVGIPSQMPDSAYAHDILYNLLRACSHEMIIWCGIETNWAPTFGKPRSTSVRRKHCYV